jgi:hypothetical protein
VIVLSCSSLRWVEHSKKTAKQFFNLTLKGILQRSLIPLGTKLRSLELPATMYHRMTPMSYGIISIIVKVPSLSRVVVMKVGIRQ